MNFTLKHPQEKIPTFWSIFRANPSYDLLIMTQFSDWPRDRLPRGIPLIQILFAITLDFLQIYKSEKLKVHFQLFENATVKITIVYDG